MSTGAAAVLSLFVPGLGQLCRGRPIAAGLWFICSVVGYLLCVVPGIIIHIACIVEVAQSEG